MRNEQQAKELEECRAYIEYLQSVLNEKNINYTYQSGLWTGKPFGNGRLR